MSKETRFNSFRKHAYVNPNAANLDLRPMPDVAPNWVGYTCLHCNNVSGLNAWQIRIMPIDMAKCAVGKRAITEITLVKFGLKNGVNCLKRE